MLAEVLETDAEWRAKVDGWAETAARSLVRTNNTVIAALAVARGEADAMITGLEGRFMSRLRHIKDIIGLAPGVCDISAMTLIITNKGAFFLADTHVKNDPTAEEIADMTVLAASHVTRFGIEPKVALCSSSQFGNLDCDTGRRMRAALESGLPFATAVAELEGVEMPAPLAAAAGSGVPTLASLQARFPEAARRALEDSLRADLGDTTAERLGSFLRTQVGARSLTPREGTDPDAVLSRAEAALAEGRLADALAEIAALPDPGRAALADWTAQAQLRLDAAAALDALAVTLGEG